MLGSTLKAPLRSTHGPSMAATSAIAACFLVFLVWATHARVNGGTQPFRLRQATPAWNIAMGKDSGSLLTSPAFAGARAHAAPLRYDAALMNKWGLHRPTCAPGLDFLVTNTSMSERWVCQNAGELSVLAAMRRVLDAECAQVGSPGLQPGLNNLFLDVGSNSGFYGLMAIAAGCPAVFFDLQPACNKVVTGALLANGWAHKGLVVAGGLSEASSTVMASSNGTCDFASGRFPLNVVEAGTADQGDVRVPTEPLNTFLGPDTHILMMKVDTEGFEQRVLAGCLPYFERRLIKHAIVEVTPGFMAWEKRGIDAVDVANTFERIVRSGYSITLLGSWNVKPGNKERMTDPSAVRDWVLARREGQVNVLLSLA